MRLIPGVELSCDVPGGEVHMLGYFMDVDDSGFQDILATFRQGRLARGEGMVKKLAEFGMHIEWERVLEIAGDASVGRPHVADALLKPDISQNVQTRFENIWVVTARLTWSVAN